MEIVADTTVLIDLWRYQKTPDRLSDLTRNAGDAAILIPWITQVEFSRGAMFKDVSPDVIRQPLTIIAGCGSRWRGAGEHRATPICGSLPLRWRSMCRS